MIDNVAIYLRKSRKEDGISVDEALKNHEERLTSLAKGNGWDYVIFKEVASGASSERSQLNLMLSQLYRFEAVLVMDIDRLSRDRYVSADIMKRLKDHNVQIVTADNRIIDLNNPTDEIMAGMQEVFANYELIQINKRLQRGKLSGAQKGHWVSGRVPLGYLYDKNLKRLVCNPEESDVIRAIFMWYARGDSAEAICIELNRQGKTGKNGAPFSTAGIMRILRNDVYIGHTTMMEKVTQHTHEPLVLESRWDKVQERLNLNKGKGSRIAHGLSGLISCGYCGKALAVMYNPSGTRKIKGCHRRDIVTGELCTNKGMNYQEMLKAVLGEVSKYRSSIVNELEKVTERQGEFEVSIEDKIAHKSNEKSKAQAKVARLNRAYMNGDLTDEEFSDLKQEQTEYIEKCEGDIEHLKNDTSQSYAERYISLIQVLDDVLQPKDIHLGEKALNELLRSVILEARFYHLNEEPRLVIEWRE